MKQNRVALVDSGPRLDAYAGIERTKSTARKQFTVEIMHHDSANTFTHYGVVACVLGAHWLSLHFADGRVYSYPREEVFRVKELHA